MVTAVVLEDFTADGIRYQKGQTVSIPDDQYDQWSVKNLVGPGGSPTAVASNLVGPGNEEK